MIYVSSASSAAPKPFAATCSEQEYPLDPTSFRIFTVAIRTFTFLPTLFRKKEPVKEENTLLLYYTASASSA